MRRDVRRVAEPEARRDTGIQNRERVLPGKTRKIVVDRNRPEIHRAVGSAAGSGDDPNDCVAKAHSFAGEIEAGQGLVVVVLARDVRLTDEDLGNPAGVELGHVVPEVHWGGRGVSHRGPGAHQSSNHCRTTGFCDLAQEALVIGEIVNGDFARVHPRDPTKHADIPVITNFSWSHNEAGIAAVPQRFAYTCFDI